MNDEKSKMTEDDRTTFTQIDRQYVLERRLEKDFPEYSMIEELKHLLETMQVACEDLRHLLSPERPHKWQDGDSQKDQKRIKYTSFAIASIHLSIEEYYYNKVEKFRNAAQAKVKLDSWKTTIEVLTVKSLRNRVQHKPMMDGTLHIDWIADETKHGKFKLNFRLYENEISKGSKKLSAERSELVKNYLKANKDNENFIIELLSKYLDRTMSLLTDLQDIYQIEFEDESKARNEVLTELQEIENWFEAKGLSRVSL